MQKFTLCVAKHLFPNTFVVTHSPPIQQSAVPHILALLVHALAKIAEFLCAHKAICQGGNWLTSKAAGLDFTSEFAEKKMENK